MQKDGCRTSRYARNCHIFDLLGSPKPSSGGTQRSNTSLSKVEPWMDNDSLELISNPESNRLPRKFNHPISPKDEEAIQAFKPAQSGLPLHFTNPSLEGMENGNSMDNENLSYLHRAVRTNDARAVNTILDNGADIDRKDKDGFTPLHAAVRYVLGTWH